MSRLALAAHDVVGWSRRDGEKAAAGQCHRLVDLCDRVAVATGLRAVDPDVLIHLGAISSADEVGRDPRTAWEVNVEATRRLAEWAEGNDRRLIFASTDLVFDGTKCWYREDDSPRPVLEYGRTKRAAELAVGEERRNLTVRLSLLYGNAPPGREGFFDRAIASLRAGVPQAFFNDEYRTPLDYATAARAFAEFAESQLSGTIHLGGRERLSRFELMQRAASALGIDPGQVRPSSLTAQHTAEPRPADVSLDTARLRTLFPELTIPTIETALADMDD
jgi:dTDP-4-dehydrorhamnose reductase